MLANTDPGALCAKFFWGVGEIRNFHPLCGLCHRLYRPPDPARFVFHVVFSRLVGLRPGDHVRLMGVRVGKVEHVRIAQFGDDRQPVVDLTVALTDSKIRIREADSFQVGTVGLLGGAYVEIDPAKAKSLPIVERSTVTGGVMAAFPFSPNLVADMEPLMKVAKKLADLPPTERKAMIERFIKLLDEVPMSPSHQKAGQLGNKTN